MQDVQTSPDRLAPVDERGVHHLVDRVQLPTSIGGIYIIRGDGADTHLVDVKDGNWDRMIKHGTPGMLKCVRCKEWYRAEVVHRCQ